jgi:hypothetical protein
MKRRIIARRDLAAWLIERVPALRSRYQKETEYYDEPSSSAYFILSSVLKPYLESLLGHDDVEAQRIFDLLEYLANNGDDEPLSGSVQNELRVMMEELDLSRVWPFLGPTMQAKEFESLTWFPERSDRVTQINQHVDKTEFQRRWREEIEKIGGFENLTGIENMKIRYRLVKEFEVVGLRAPEPGETRWLLEGLPPVPAEEQ